jgi:hypothetical protein
MAASPDWTFDSSVLEARAPIPPAWSEKYDFAFVRDGYLVRQHVDSAGHLAAIDAVGPGCAFPLLHGDKPTAGYALNRALVCLCTPENLERALSLGGATAVRLYRLLREAFERVERLAHARGRGSAPSKVAGLLCALSGTLQPELADAAVPADFLQRDLAALLSIRHESVCRVLRTFNDEGLTERTADSLRLLQPASLQRL